MSRILIGRRIRERRRALGISQRALAERLSISTAYLSLIENDKRLIAGGLLRKAADALGVDLEFLSASRDARLADDLTELTSALGLSELEGQASTDLASRHPQWARTLIRLHRDLQDARDAALTLADRLNRDPALVTLSHQTLTEITAIRSAAEILAQYETLETDQRRRFVDIIAKASDQLTASARAMLDMLEGPDAPTPAATPAREVEDFIIDHGNFFETIEDAAPRIVDTLPGHGLGLSAVLAARLEERHGVRIVRAEDGGAGPGTIALPAGAPEATVRFTLARELAARELADAIEAIAATGSFSSDETRRRARNALARYGAGTVLMPYDRFLETAEARRYDLSHLQARFNASFEQVAHRLVTLRRPGAEGVPFAFVRTDPAGNISKRFSLPGLRMPQFGGACPLWALYGAFSAGDRLVAQRAAMPDGRHLLLVARQVRKGTPSTVEPEARYAVMLACDAHHGHRIVHADGLGPDNVVPVGWECRSCPREACEQRAFPMLSVTAPRPSPPARSSHPDGLLDAAPRM
ncbi:helix-turn-helix domain-containing protein [Roseitalea porphyridii]|nr:short-chain fatty acyl-CoA regulator family protein [Roseitalea porphyridii]